MSARRRLGLVLVGLPLAFYAYACSSESDPGSDETEDGGTEGSTNPGVDSSTGTDSSVGDSSTGADAADASDGAVPPTCLGNPLTPDGGTADGGANLDASVASNILTVFAGTFLDGPQWVDTATGGYLAYSENDPNEALRRIAEDGGGGAALRTAPLGDGLVPTGNAVRNGFILTLASDKATNGRASVILQTAADGGAGPTIALGMDAGSPNDLVVGKGGHLYFTDPRYQANGGLPPTGIFSTAADGGGLNRFAIFTGGEKPNGIALSPDGTKLYVAFTEPKRVDSYPVAANGTVTPTATAVVPGVKLTDAPDGIAVDVGGNLYVAEADAVGGLDGRVEVFKPNGDKWGEIPLPGVRPTGVAFGGVDKKTLFITYENGIRVYKGRCAGLSQN